jgi:hypothetical protein
MSTLIRIFAWFYTQGLKLYPKEFRADFGDEMQTVFRTASNEIETGGIFGLLAFFGREIREWPGSLLREYWYAWTNKEVIMATNFKRPTWLFYPGWVVLSILPFPLAWLSYFGIISLVTRWVGDTIIVNGQRRITEDYLFSYIFFPMLCLLAGFLQYLLLRCYAPKMGWWILATGAGSLAAIAAIGLLQSVFDFAKLSIWGNALIFGTMGGAIGLSQWVFLRRRIPKAGWWIFASMLGWALAVLGSLTEVRNGSALAQLLTVSLSPAIVASLAWWYLLKPKAQQENQLSG